MGKLEKRKTAAVFETTNAIYERRQQRPVIVTLKPGYMSLRLKGTRREYLLSYTSALNLAIRNEAARKRLEKSKGLPVSR